MPDWSHRRRNHFRGLTGHKLYAAESPSVVNSPTLYTHMDAHSTELESLQAAPSNGISPMVASPSATACTTPSAINSTGSYSQRKLSALQTTCTRLSRFWR